jgi:hypothetical protein
MQSEEDSLIRELVDTIIREANPDTFILILRTISSVAPNGKERFYMRAPDHAQSL